MYVCIIVESIFPFNRRARSVIRSGTKVVQRIGQGILSKLLVVCVCVCVCVHFLTFIPHTPLCHSSPDYAEQMQSPETDQPLPLSSCGEFSDGTTTISCCLRPGQSYRPHSKWQTVAVLTRVVHLLETEFRVSLHNYHRSACQPILAATPPRCPNLRWFCPCRPWQCIRSHNPHQWETSNSVSAATACPQSIHIVSHHATWWSTSPTTFSAGSCPLSGSWKHSTLNTPHFNATEQHTVQCQAQHPEHTALQRHWTTHCPKSDTAPWTHHTSTPLSNILSNVRHSTLNTPHFNATEQHTVIFYIQYLNTRRPFLQRTCKQTDTLYANTNTKPTLLSLALRCADSHLDGWDVSTIAVNWNCLPTATCTVTLLLQHVAIGELRSSGLFRSE